MEGGDYLQGGDSILAFCKLAPKNTQHKPPPLFLSWNQALVIVKGTSRGPSIIKCPQNKWDLIEFMGIYTYYV